MRLDTQRFACLLHARHAALECMRSSALNATYGRIALSACHMEICN